MADGIPLVLLPEGIGEPEAMGEPMPELALGPMEGIGEATGVAVPETATPEPAQMPPRAA